MARKVTLTVIRPIFENKMAVISHLNGIILLKSLLSPLSLLLEVPNVKKKLEGSQGLRLFSNC